MGKTSAALGIQGSSITHKGVAYKLSPWTYSIQAQFERYLEDHVMGVYSRMKRHMTPEESKEELRRLNKEIASGEYTFGSDTVARMLGSLPHLKQLFYLMLKPNHPEVSMETVNEIVDAQLEEVMAGMSLANADPSTPAPESSPTPA